MDFSDYSIEEINNLTSELTQFIKKYTEEKLKGFTEKEKIIIVITAVSNLFTIIHVTNINLGMISFEAFLRSENLIIDYIRKETKANRK